MSNSRLKYVAHSLDGTPIAAFLLERDRDIFATEIVPNNPCQTVRRVVTTAKRSAVNAETSGDNPREAYDHALEKLGELSMAIADARAELLRLKNHTHKFDSTDHCVHCGLDGRG